MFVNNVEVDTASMLPGGTWKLDISDVALDGTNTIQVTGITPSQLAKRCDGTYSISCGHRRGPV